MNALVERTDFGITTSSRTVAEVFEKEHRNVLASIDDILSKQATRCASNFRRTSAKVKMPNGGEREVRAFDMDRDGFTLLAMGFTGEKALDWKLAYIEAFNRMETELAERSDAPVVLDALELAPALAVVREARQLFGRPVARRLWPQLGLPEVARTDEIRYELATGYELPETISSWMEYRVLIDDAAQCHSSALFKSYEQWCHDNDEIAENQTNFGRALTHMGYPSKKSSQGNMLRTGLRLVT
ncbi:Rha family transcriptional regulator [Croceicoccus gelatinilyticus]|uniref:Rha family transcriptional regulator n=1 Tax=Croceicoccus gelatinilyticus TaxID=2835536 RepID=UPI001BCFA244|nr:Rha family transcriptional regulator [Croceicoccus gelatinilyticus]MBS7669330.1 Rha family transcriptional regulator [Croceicoccus gelatinilyticus]